MKILIVDDDEFCIRVLADILKEIGQCDTARNGSEAIDAIMRSRTDGAPYDLICLDIIMPDIDGFQVLKQIRAMEELDGVSFPDSLRVILISSMSDLEHIMISLDPQCEVYMLKPFNREQLFIQLGNLGISV